MCGPAARFDHGLTMDSGNKLYKREEIFGTSWASRVGHKTNFRDVQFCNEPTLIVIRWGKFVAERLSSVFTAETKSWRPQI